MIICALFCIAISDENAVASHSLEFAAQNAMRYHLSATLMIIVPVERNAD